MELRKGNWQGEARGEEEDDETKNHILKKKKANNAMIYTGGRQGMPGGQGIYKWTDCTE